MLTPSEPASPRTRITLIRHGQSSFNALGLYQGVSDEPVLTDRGRAQARAAAALLAEARFDAVYASPLRRAAETAAVLAAEIRDLPAPAILDLLREIDLPEWEGRAFRDVAAETPERLRQWRFGPSDFTMTQPCGALHYPCQDIRGRADAFLTRVLRQHSGGHVLAVTHGGFIRGAISVALRADPDKLHAIAQDNCAVTTLAMEASGDWSIERLNETVAPAHERLQAAAHEPELQVMAASGAKPSAQAATMLPFEMLQSTLGSVVGVADPAKLNLAADRLHMIAAEKPLRPAELRLLNAAL